MKKTIVMLLALGSVATATNTEDLLFTTDTNGKTLNRVTVDGIVFTLSDNARLNANKDYSKAEDFHLTSIDVLVRDDSTWGAGTCMYVVDANRKLIAVSENVAADSAANTYVSFTFNDTCSLLQENKERTNSALTFGETYYAYFAPTSNITGRSWQVGVLGIGDIVNWLDASGKGVGGYVSYDADTVYDLACATHTRTQGVGDVVAIYNNVKAFAPAVKINGTISVPEPATATLSLLALAGLAARRRRH